MLRCPGRSPELPDHAAVRDAGWRRWNSRGGSPSSCRRHPGGAPTTIARTGNSVCITSRRGCARTPPAVTCVW